MRRKTKTRTFDADLILLPILDAGSAHTLGVRLLAQAKAEDLPENIRVASRRLARALSGLTAATRSHLGVPSDGDGERVEAQHAWREAWRGLHGWLRSWTHLADANALEATRIFDAIGASGLEFLRIHGKSAWAESDDRVSWLRGTDDTFRSLGGIGFLRALRTAHQRYGDVLGLTKPRLAMPKGQAIREPLDAFRFEVKRYILQVVAHGDLDSHEAKERAERLLVPLTDWPSRGRRRRSNVSDVDRTGIDD